MSFLGRIIYGVFCIWFYILMTTMLDSKLTGVSFMDTFEMQSMTNDFIEQCTEVLKESSECVFKKED